MDYGKVKIEIEVDLTDVEGTDSPYWLILDPRQNMSCDIYHLSSQITGIFFSREDAERHLSSRRYAFSDRAAVFCCSGYWSHQYKTKIREAELKWTVENAQVVEERRRKEKAYLDLIKL